MSRESTEFSQSPIFLRLGTTALRLIIMQSNRKQPKKPPLLHFYYDSIIRMNYYSGQQKYMHIENVGFVKSPIF
jgi:hypothetical protein